MNGFLFSILEYCRSGGLMMVPIIVVSLVMWSLILIKLQEIHEINRNDVGTLETVSRVQNGVGLQTIGTPLSHVVFHFMEQMTVDRQLNQDLLTSLVNRETSRLSRNINVIYVLASIAPLLGLLGTVGGMISTFDAIAMYGTGNARAMAQGISAALITTQSGLFVSIPGLFMASFLHRRIGRIAQQLDEFRAAMMKELNLNFHQAMG
ncbi:MAG: MotA/TolQ/ExbB proton channel family protein [Pseudomonadota bacterium]|nr:MotA/TolQ/ExbB proton channel family protein [Pseudomonadota bacterium]